MLVSLITPPALEPITLQEALDHLRLDLGVDNATVTAAIAGARKYAEEFLWRGLVTQTWELVLEAFPDDGCLPVKSMQRQGIELPKGNLVSVTSVKYIDGNGTEQTMSTGDYTVDTVSEPGRIRLAYNKTWPTVRPQWDAVRVRYVVGWSVANVPQPIKNALLLLVAQLYENRVPEVAGTLSSIEFAVEALLGPYRLRRF